MNATEQRLRPSPLLAAGERVFGLARREWLALATLAVLLGSAIVYRYGILPAAGSSRGDFANYYTAARLLLAGEPLARGYQDFVWFQQQMDRQGIEHQVGGFIPHPPSTALVLLPLAGFDAVTARTIWTWLNAGFAVLAIVALQRLTGLHWLAAALALLGTGFGLINQFLFGQQYLLLVATLFSGLWAWRQQRPVLAGILIGVLIPVKYVGLFFIAWFAWRRQWRLVAAALATAAAVVLLTLILAGSEPFRVFMAEVLPRHLRGEIQDPFAVQFQTWNSLLRRLFVFDASLNPQPLVDAPLLFVFLRSLIFWSLLAAFVWLIAGFRLADTRQQRLFELGSLPLLILLISPGSATYHFLLLSLTAAVMMALLWRWRRPVALLVLAGLFVAINLPHYPKLMALAHNWQTPLAYPRLWLLLAFAVALWITVRSHLQRRPGHPSFAPLPLIGVAMLVALSTFTGYRSLAAGEDDGARLIAPPHGDFRRHLGLIVKSPAVGDQQIVFSYCELLDDRYAIYTTGQGRWTPPMTRNFYAPALAANDTALLVHTITDGRDEIWLSDGPGRLLHFVTAGTQPAWQHGNDAFVFVREHELWAATRSQDGWKERRLLALPPGTRFTGVSCSAAGDHVAFASAGDTGFHLQILATATGDTSVLLHSEVRLEQPALSPDDQIVLFAWRKHGQRDIFALDRRDGSIHRLTSHRGEDTAPVWDAAGRRIIFVSDRGRGLEMSALYEIPWSAGATLQP